VLDDAICRGEAPELFFGPAREESRRERHERERRAKALCDACPALDACRSLALQRLELYGVWGGLGEQERRAHLMRAGRLAVVGT
jgi:WhiB family transcriptional regulator, redox-sensing transcriptional regulator